jgi:hypothetical protein
MSVVVAGGFIVKVFESLEMAVLFDVLVAPGPPGSLLLQPTNATRQSAIPILIILNIAFSVLLELLSRSYWKKKRN